MGNQYDDVMTELSNAELLEIVTKLRNEYEPDAILAAENELTRRNLSTDEVRQTESIIEDKYEEIVQKANAPLQDHWKVLTLLLPGFINLMIARSLKNDGYDRKYQEARRWTLYGCGFYIGLAVVLSLVSAIIRYLL